MCSCRAGCLDMAAALLEFRADACAVIDFGTTALYLASKQGSVDLINLLVDAGASVNAVGGYAPLLGSCKKGRAEAVKVSVNQPFPALLSSSSFVIIIHSVIHKVCATQPFPFFSPLPTVIIIHKGAWCQRS